RNLRELDGLVISDAPFFTALSEVGDDGVCVFAGLHRFGVVIADDVAGATTSLGIFFRRYEDGVFYFLRGLELVEMAQHKDASENDGRRVDDVLAGVFGG